MPSSGLDAAGGTVVRPDRRAHRPSEPTDGELFARIAEGSSEAFAKLYERYFHELYDFAARITRDRAAAADIVQNAFTAAWERAKRGEEVASPRAWLYRVTHNAAIDELRRRGRTTGPVGHDDVDFAAVEDVDAEEPTRVLIDKELAELVWATAAALDPQEYALLDLHVRRGLGPDELAQQLSISSGAVHTRLSRLRRSFEDALTVTLLTRRGGRDCSELRGLLTAQRETAEGRAGRQSIRAHIRNCSTCQAARRRHVTAAAILANLAPVPLIPGVQDAIWAKLSALLGLSAAGGAAAAAHGASAEGAARAGRFVGRHGHEIAAGATVTAAIVAAVGLVAHFAFAPAPRAGAARDPAHVWSPSNSVGKPSTRNRITIVWSRQPAATAYSVLWSHGARDEPDTVADRPGTATRSTSPALAPGRWYFHLRTRGQDGSWTDTVHLGPFIVLARAAAGAVTAKGQAAGGSAGPGTAHAQPPAAERGQPHAAESGAPAAAAPPPPARAADATAPSGQAVELAGGPYVRTLSVRLVLNEGNDLGSGVDSASGVVQRQSAALADGKCGGWSGWQRVGLHAGADTTVADGRCYRYRYRVSDRAGNASPFSVPSGTAKIDTTAPTAPALTLVATGRDTAVTGTTLFYRPSGAGGTFSVTAVSADAGSGIAAVEFPGLGAGMSPTVATRRTARPYALAYTWVAGAAAAGTETVTVFDRAGNSSSSRFRIESDASGPEGMSVSLVGGPMFTGSVPVTVGTGTDTGSGVDPTSARVERDAAPLAPDETCGGFTGAWTSVTLQGDVDALVARGTCYRYRVSVGDNVGNRATSPPSATATVAPVPAAAFTLSLRATSPTTYASGTTLFYRPDLPGSFTAEAAISHGARVDSVMFPLLGGADGGGVDDSAPFASAYSWIFLAVAGPQPVTASNGSGGSTSVALTLEPDADPPTGVRTTVAGGWVAGPVIVTVDAGSDSGSGLDATSLRLERDTAPVMPGGTCGVFAGSWTAVTLDAATDTSVADGTCYRYRAEIADNVGNRAVSAPSATASVDTAPPTGLSVALVGGSTHVGAVPLKVDWGTDGGSGIDETSELVERDSAPLASDDTCGSFTGAWTRVEFHGSSTVDNGVAHDTCYRYRAVVSDKAGNRATSPPSDIAKVR